MCEDDDTLPDMAACNLIKRTDHTLAELFRWLTICERVPAACRSRDAYNVRVAFVNGPGQCFQVVSFLDNRDGAYLADANLGKAFDKCEFHAEVFEEWGSCLLATA